MALQRVQLFVSGTAVPRGLMVNCAIPAATNAVMPCCETLLRSERDHIPAGAGRENGDFIRPTYGAFAGSRIVTPRNSRVTPGQLAVS